MKPLNLSAPLYISSRLLASVKVGDSEMSVNPIGYSADDREVWSYSIYDDSGAEIATGSDLQSGCGQSCDASEMMSTLISFLLACAESIPNGTENANLFPESSHEWIVSHESELEMLAFELDGDSYFDR